MTAKKTRFHRRCAQRRGFLRVLKTLMHIPLRLHRATRRFLPCHPLSSLAAALLGPNRPFFRLRCALPSSLSPSHLVKPLPTAIFFHLLASPALKTRHMARNGFGVCVRLRELAPSLTLALRLIRRSPSSSLLLSLLCIHVLPFYTHFTQYTVFWHPKTCVFLAIFPQMRRFAIFKLRPLAFWG